jgi:hypothetical protein
MGIEQKRAAAPGDAHDYGYCETPHLHSPHSVAMPPVRYMRRYFGALSFLDLTLVVLLFVVEVVRMVWVAGTVKWWCVAFCVQLF